MKGKVIHEEHSPTPSASGRDPDGQETVFKFGPPCAAEFTLAVPYRLRVPKDIFGMDADGIHETKWHCIDRGVVIDDLRSRVAMGRTLM